MDHYRLSALAQSQDGCESRHHINPILVAAYPPIDITRDETRDLFEEYREREGKMFFSRKVLEKYFEQDDILKRLFSCECKDCVAARPDDPLPKEDVLNRIRGLPIKAPLLGLMIYLGKLHYVYYWIKWRIVHEGLGSVPECPGDDTLKKLISSHVDRIMFHGAYRRAARMFTPVIFTIPNNVCPYLEFWDIDRFPYLNEELNDTQGSFGVVRKIEILDDYLDESLRERMKEYKSSGTGVGSDRKLLFALKSVKPISTTNMERDMLNMVSRINGPASDNIITLMAYYTWKDEIHFLFPFIESDLKRVLRQGECPSGRQARLSSGQLLPDHWLWQQMKGVSRALSAIHTEMVNPFKDGQGNVIALHFDLKPANILITADGILKITDFGQSIIQVVQEDDERTAPYNPGNLRYSPPESRPTAQDVGKCGTYRSKEIQVLLNYDVWSLACIMIEVLIHLLNQQTLTDFDTGLGVEPRRLYWTDSGLKKCVIDSFELFQEKFAHDSAQHEYIKNVVELLQKMLKHDKNGRAHSSEVVDGLEGAEEVFRQLYQGLDAVSLKVRKYELVEGTDFRELGWHNGASFVSFHEKAGITLDVVDRENGQSDYHNPKPCRIRVFSKRSGSNRDTCNEERGPSAIALVWGLESEGVLYTGQKKIKPSEWCIAPRYLSRRETNGDVRFECVLFPRLQGPSYDKAFIFGFESPEDAQTFQGTILQKRILPPIRAQDLAIAPKKRRDAPKFDQGESNIQLWARAKAKYLKAPKSNIGMSPPPPSIKSANQPDEEQGKEQCKTMVIFFKDQSPLVMTLSNGRKRFRLINPNLREVYIALHKNIGFQSFKAVQTRMYRAWNSQDPDEAQRGQFPSLPVEADFTNLDLLEEPDCFKIDNIKIAISTFEDLEQFRRGAGKEWRD